MCVCVCVCVCNVKVKPLLWPTQQLAQEPTIISIKQIRYCTAYSFNNQLTRASDIQSRAEAKSMKKKVQT